MVLSPKFNWKEWVIVGVVMLVLAAIAIPNFVRARVTRCNDAVENNLRLVDAAKTQWALENRKLPTDAVSLSDLTGYFGNKGIPQPLYGETYSVSTVSALAEAVLSDVNPTRPKLSDPAHKTRGLQTATLPPG